ncbi:MAG: septal ring lytic transglycosylase RlpA family protein [Nitrospirae bacterium]|nr:septal ring lytic transglycosylase RlpA family protein [Nitrospirota bacterium]
MSSVLVVSLVVILVVGLIAAPSEAKKYAAASWYGKEYHGRRTSSGVIYDMNSSQGAHKTLPFGTNLRVTNPKNGKSTNVRITDRGPFVKSRDIDLSYKCAKEIGIVNSGVSNVKIDYILKDGPKTKYVDITDMKTLPDRLSKTAFLDYKNASVMKHMLRGPQAKHTYIAKSIVGGRPVYVVSSNKGKATRTLARNSYDRPGNHGLQYRTIILSALRSKIDRSKAVNMVALMSTYDNTPVRPFIGPGISSAFMPHEYIASSDYISYKLPV